jgi:hypothetical protein
MIRCPNLGVAYLSSENACSHCNFSPQRVDGFLKPGGGLLLTVPQHQWLWSSADEYACHFRRYSAPELHGKLRSAGFEIVRSTSFVSLLLPAMLISRRRAKGNKTYDPLDEFRISPLLNLAFEKALTIERWLIRMGLNLPLGGSRIVIA